MQSLQSFGKDKGCIIPVQEKTCSDTHPDEEAIMGWVNFYHKNPDEEDMSWMIEKVLPLSQIKRTTFYWYIVEFVKSL